MMNTIAESLHPQLIEAFGWTLIHSLWQGTLIALVIAIALAFISKKNPQIRYGIILSGLMLMVGWSGYTFYQEIVAVENGSFEASFIMVEFAEEAMDSRISSPITWIGKLKSIPLFIEPYLSEIMMVWLMGYLFFSIRWAGSLYYLHRLRTHDIFPLEHEWQLQLKKLSRRMGLKSRVSLLESSRIQTPMIIGYFKPAILLPAGLLTGISPQQLEAIFAHELAHIIRKDFLVNMITAFGETLFFYHPAYWWMSHQISIEREHCCDDVAIAFCGDPLIYAKTLTNLAEMKIQPTSLAVAMTGSRGSLLERIQRILQPNHTVAGFPAKAFLSFLLLLGLTSTAWLAPVQGNNPPKIKPSQQFYPGVSFYPQTTEPTPASILESTDLSIHEVRVEESQPFPITKIDWQIAPLSFTVVDSPAPIMTTPIELAPPMPVLPTLPEMPKMPELSEEIRTQPEQFEFQMRAFESQMVSWEKSFESIMSLHEKELGLWKESFESFQQGLSNTQMVSIELEQQLAQLQQLKSLEKMKHVIQNDWEALKQDEKLMQEDKREIQEMNERRLLERELARHELENKRRNTEQKRRVLDQSMAQAEKQRMEMELARKQQEITRRKMETQRRNLEKELRDQERRQRRSDFDQPQKNHKHITRELEKDGLLGKDPNRIQIKKSPSSLKINGQKLSPELEKKYRYLLKKWGFNLGDKSSFSMTFK